MSMAKASATWDTRELEEKLRRIGSDVDNQIDRIFDYNAAWGTTWMKLNAPWTDDTGAARSSLIAVAASRGSSHEITVAHGVHYGIWLEVANSGRFQILNPAMRAIGTNVMKSMTGLLDGNPPNLGSPTRTIPPVARKVARKGTSKKSGKAHGVRKLKPGANKSGRGRRI
jgi:hypothetical protein